MKQTTTVKDKKYKAVRKRFNQAKRSFVTIGVHSDSGNYDNGATVAEVAFWNEFGTRKAPARPFIRSTVDKKRKEFNKYAKELFIEISYKSIKVDKALDKLGVRIREEIRNTIKNLWTPPNAPSTIARKGGVLSATSKPLIDTGKLLSMIGYQTNVFDARFKGLARKSKVKRSK